MKQDKVRAPDKDGMPTGDWVAALHVVQLIVSQVCSYYTVIPVTSYAADWHPHPHAHVAMAGVGFLKVG